MPFSHYHLEALAQEVGARLDRFIAGHVQALSRSRVQALIEAGHVTVNNNPVTDCSYRVRQKDMISIAVPPPVSTEMLPADIPLDVIYEDKHMLVINKPVGMTVHPGAGNYQDTMANALLAHCGNELSGIGGVSRPGIVHRLDKDTSGLLLVAKTDNAHQSLSRQIAAREVKRIYIAVIWGVPSPPRGTITGNIARSNRDRTKMMIVKSGGKEAVTHYQLKEVLAGGKASIVECRLQTGRTHQIRLHLTSKGHPLIGDQTYGGGITRRLVSLTPEAQHYIAHFKRQALHSVQIGFSHPETGEYKEYCTPMPADMQKLIASLQEKEYECAIPSL